MENDILEAIMTIDDYSKLLYTNFNNGMSRINDIVNIIQIYIEAFLNKIDKYNSLGENISTDVIINQLNNLMNAIEYKDQVLLIDTLRYEIEDTLNLYRKLVIKYGE